MASAILHIKDSYYFEVPRSLWPARFRDKTEFPEIWVRLDPDFQRWEAERLYDEYVKFRDTEVAPKEDLIRDWLEWQHHGHNAQKPFSRFLEEEHDATYFSTLYLGGKEKWEAAKDVAGKITTFNDDASIKWSPAKVDGYNRHLSGKILIPQPFGGELRNLYEKDSGFAISKFMIIEVAVALLLWGVFSWLGTQVKGGDRPKGRLWNLLEVFVVFIRDQIARPAIGQKDADRFVPLLLTLFFFVLGCNLSGMIPWIGAPTGAFGTTAGLALVTFGTGVFFGMVKFGPFGYFLNQIPGMDLPLILAVILKPIILAIELLALLIKHAVLAVRLVANMVAGHLVLLAIMLLAFSVEGVANDFWGLTAVISVVGSTLISCLELFVAFLQAYIFTLLSAIFIGASIHHH